MRQTAMLVTLLVALSVTGTFAAEWPWLYGPRRDGTSEQKGLLRTWPAEGPKVLWSAPVGAGFGGPAISGGKVYLLDRDEKVGDTLRVFDFATGKELWSFAYDAPGTFMFPGSRTTPTVDGNRVYTSGPLGDLHAIDTTSQKPIWRKNIWKEFGGGELPRWAVVQHPLIYGNLLIVAPQTPQAGVVAYDKLTGDLKWKSAALSGTAQLCQPVDREDRRRGSPGDDHRQRRTRPQREGRHRHRPRPAHREGAVDLQGLAEPHPRAAAGGRRGRPPAHHGRIRRRHGDDQGREEGGRQLRRDGSVQERRGRVAHAAADPRQGPFLLAQHGQRAERRAPRDGHGRPGEVEDRHDSRRSPAAERSSPKACCSPPTATRSCISSSRTRPGSSRSPAPRSSKRATTGRRWRWPTASCSCAARSR